MAEDVTHTCKLFVANEALDEIGEKLRARGLTLEKLIESGRKEREKIIQDESIMRTCRPNRE